MMIDRLMKIAFSGQPDAEGPPTWGQVAMMRLLVGLGEQHPIQNVCVSWSIPDGRSVADVAAAVRRVTERHEILRTVFAGFGSSDMTQRVAGAGTVDLEVLQVPDLPAAAELAGRIRAGVKQQPLDPERRWPYWWKVVVVDGAARRLLFGASHLLVDGAAMELLQAEVQLLMSDARADPGPVWQPLQQAHREREQVFRDRSEHAMRYWRGLLSRAPVSMFDVPATAPQSSPMWRMLMRSSAVTHALRMVSRRVGVSTATVLLAASAVALAHLTDHERVLLKVVALNRSDRDTRRLLACQTQDGLLGLAVAGESFDELSRQARASGLLALRMTGYDPYRLDEVVEQVRYERGARPELHAGVNDVRHLTDGAGDAGPPDTDPADLVPSTTLAVDGTWPQQAVKYFVSAGQAGEVTELRLLADTGYLPPPVMGQLLRGLEALLVVAAYRNVPAGEIAGILGVRPLPRDASWQRVRDCWLRPAAVAELLERHPGVRSARVRLTGDPGAESLHCLAQVADAALTPRALHRWLVESATDRTDVLAPDEYQLQP